MLSMENGTNKRPRPFFTSPEELLEEEYFDEQLPEKKRRLTPEQVNKFNFFEILLNFQNSKRIKLRTIEIIN